MDFLLCVALRALRESSCLSVAHDSESHAEIAEHAKEKDKSGTAPTRSVMV